MTDPRAEALHHLDRAAQAHPGTPGERYHSNAAATFAAIYAADVNHGHAQAIDRMAEVNLTAVASFDALAAAGPAEAAG